MFTKVLVCCFFAYVACGVVVEQVLVCCLFAYVACGVVVEQVLVCCLFAYVACGVVVEQVLVCCLFAYVACGVVVEEHLPQPYSFGYDNVDEFGTRMTRQETGDEFNNKVGSYSYVDALGVSRVVKYVADATGFHPTVETNEPGTKTSAPADAPFFSTAVEGPHPVVVKAAPVAAVHAVHAAPVAVRAVHAAPVAHVTPFAYAHQAPLAYGLAKHF
ncbi:cuticle protein 16.8-like [Ixodes scapularis]|uniref:cuticle protein 16.8-like n=1 Tax=Ixodes scapularis TaxID=6945 RepID=UPI001C383B7A|nr:cuticle protein 16.8-like [Ixodes scapularis]